MPFFVILTQLFHGGVIYYAAAESFLHSEAVSSHFIELWCYEII